MKLRDWQAKASGACVDSYQDDHKVWVTEACTGAGKTCHGAEVARRLVDASKVDLVVVVTPSIPTRASWSGIMSYRGFNATVDPTFPDGTNVWISTYAGISAIKAALGSRITKGIFLIGDEYHHAEEDENKAWGAGLNQLADLSKHILLLSGTPWRANGKIAILADRVNTHGRPYYEPGSNRVDADYVYNYADDLREKVSRGTVPVRFKFVESSFMDSRTNVTTALVLPKFTTKDEAGMSKEEEEKWLEEAKNCQITLGKFVRTSDAELSNNQLVKDVIKYCVEKLGESRLAIEKATKKRDFSIMLLVAQNVKEARLLGSFVEEVYGLRCQVIVSEDEKSADRLSDVRQKCESNARDKPDVLVSVGMISEGVDIPQIKVIGYCSGILTLLYLIQVIGRALRRISISKDSEPRKYADSTLHSTPAYFCAPAHPKIIYVARKIEKSIEDAMGSGARGSGDGEPVTPSEPANGTVDTTGETLDLYRGSTEAKWLEAVGAMVSHLRADDCCLDPNWAEYVLGLALSGDAAKAAHAQKVAQKACDCLGITFDEIWGKVETATQTSLTFDQKNRLLRKQAQHYTNLIRFSCRPFKDINENERAFMLVRSCLNDRAKLSNGFPKADLEGKQRWIKCAEDLLKSGGTDEL